jgi:hypothetical protein
MTTRSRTEMQTNLSDFYNEDIMRMLAFWREHEGMSWRRIAIMIGDDTGYRVQPTTLARWMSYERTGR